MRDSQNFARLFWGGQNFSNFIFDFQPPHISIEQGLTNRLVPKFSENQFIKQVKRDREEFPSNMNIYERNFFAIPFDHFLVSFFENFGTSGFVRPCSMDSIVWKCEEGKNRKKNRKIFRRFEVKFKYNGDVIFYWYLRKCSLQIRTVNK